MFFLNLTTPLLCLLVFTAKIQNISLHNKKSHGNIQINTEINYFAPESFFYEPFTKKNLNKLIYYMIKINLLLRIESVQFAKI